MTKRTKEILEDVGLGIGSMIILFCGCYAMETGQVGKAIFEIMCSLYIALWIHAGLISTLISEKLEKKLERDFNKPNNGHQSPTDFIES